MRNVLVTGGSRGIGRAVVRAFAACGDRVAFTYHRAFDDAAALAKETGAFPIECEMEDRLSIQVAIDRARTFFGGGIGILVNNAGIAQIKLFTDLTDEDWDRMLSVDLTSPFLFAREAAKDMIREQYGRIVNISSIWGEVGASCEVAYSAAKAGLIGLTKALAKELGPSGITVNAVAPGVIRTDMNGELSPEVLNELRDATPLCRLGEPEDVAQAVRFLCSDEASFITGQVLGSDGGFGR